MTLERHFTARFDEQGVIISFDDGTSRQYSSAVGSEILTILDSSEHTTAIFGAATAASFAEAEHAEPDPVEEHPLLELALARASRPVSAEVIPIGHLVDDTATPFADLLEERRSERALDPLPLGDLSTVLFRSARVIAWRYDERGIETSLRPHPSAGALHPLTLSVIATSVHGLPSGCWQFDALRCELVRAPHPQEHLDRALDLLAEAAQCSRIPAGILLVANPARTLSRYPRGTAHLWRDAGALLSTLHLCACDIGLASSIVGTSGVLHRFDPAGAGLVDVGALVLGASPSPMPGAQR